MPMTEAQAQRLVDQMRADREAVMQRRAAKLAGQNRQIGTAPITPAPLLTGPGRAPAGRVASVQTFGVPNANIQRDAGFLAWKAMTDKKAADYEAGKEVRLGVNNQIVARKTPDVEARRTAQNNANAMRRRAELEAFYAKRGQRLVYGPGGSVAISSAAPVPAGFSANGPALPTTVERPAAKQIPLPASMPDQLAGGELGPGYPAELLQPVAPQQAAGGQPNPAMVAGGRDRMAQVVQAATQVLGRMPKSYAEILAALGWNQKPKTRSIYDNPNTYPVIGDITPWPNEIPMFSGSP